MKILIIYKYQNHRQLVADLLAELRSRNVLISALDVVRFDVQGTLSRPKIAFAFLIRTLLKAPGLRGILLNLFRDSWVAYIAGDYEIVDIHAFSSQYGPLMKRLTKIQKKIIVTYWGSDILRSTEDERARQKLLLGMAAGVRTTGPQAYATVREWAITTPTEMCRFGVGNLNIIKEARTLDAPELTKRIFEVLPAIDHNKTTIAIGNNGSENQQHLNVIHELNAIDSVLRRNLQLVIPATYGLNSRYREVLSQALHAGGWDYCLLDTFLPPQSMALVIARTDIFITAQLSDNFSTYVQEHLASGTVVFAGKWLPYFMLRKNGVYIHDFDFDNLKEKLQATLRILREEKTRCKIHNDIVFEISSWGYLGDSWEKSYLAHC